ncbi:uncharacterized protein LOC113378588 [Ctenocephalides felis]|nr:uncharacterized protein LOC113378588 [Ctenocephalides felis]
MDIDQLAVLLEQNHDLLRDMAVNETEEMSAMPRTLLDLINQVQKSTENRTESCSDSEVSQSNTENLPANDDESCAGDNTDMSSESSESDTLTVNSAEEIVSKLQTVWRVLRELLSHQSECPKTQDVPEVEQNDGMVPKNRGSACYKSIQTPTGPRLVLSVSKTYIRLKDLIIEKKALQRELARLKQLNSHLEARFGSQQRRLGNVSSELSQTWCLAGRMQKSYKTLHSHEQILRYELQQKRKMLNELKQELQLCREKWQQAKEKNCESEVEWKRLRSEFASRKKLDLADGCGSAESGYSDERSDESDCETKNLANDCTDNLDNDVEHVGSSNDIVEEDEHVLSHNNDVVEDEIVNVINSIEIEELSGNDINEIDGVEVEDETDIHINKENSCKSDFNTTQIGDGSNNVTVVDNPDKEGADSTLELEAQSCSSSGSFNKISNIDNDEKSQNLDKLNTCKDDKVDACSEPSTSSSFNVSLLNQPVASNSQTNPTTTRPEQTAAEKLLARDERLRKMEEQCKQLVNKVTKTSHRSKELCCRLEELHEQYGRDDQTRGETECEPAVTKEKEHSEDEE